MTSRDIAAAAAAKQTAGVRQRPEISRKQSTVFRMLGRGLLLGGALACAQPAGAAVTESAFLEDLPVVLSVSRLSQPVNEAPAAVTIIDRNMIRASGFRDIPDLLRLVPGFSVAYTRDNTWAAGYHGLGDAFSRRFQVLVDGRSIYSPHYGAVYWTDLPLSIDDIERIEVVRGPKCRDPWRKCLCSRHQHHHQDGSAGAGRIRFAAGWRAGHARVHRASWRR